jgi:hypothetical protein
MGDHRPDPSMTSADVAPRDAIGAWHVDHPRGLGRWSRLGLQAACTDRRQWRPGLQAPGVTDACYVERARSAVVVNAKSGFDS